MNNIYMKNQLVSYALFKQILRLCLRIKRNTEEVRQHASARVLCRKQIMLANWPLQITESHLPFQALGREVFLWHIVGL